MWWHAEMIAQWIGLVVSTVVQLLMWFSQQCRVLPECRGPVVELRHHQMSAGGSSALAD